MVDAIDVVESERRKYPGDDRPIFIGQAPSRDGDPDRPLTGRPGRRLAELASMDPIEFYLSTVRVNLLPRYAGANGQGDAFPLIEARRHAIELVTELDGRAVVFVGRRVAEAFGCRRGWFRWARDYVSAGGRVVEIRYAVIPHPSGRNRFWNDRRNVREASAFLSELMGAESGVPRLRALRERARVDAVKGVMGEGAGRLQARHAAAGSGRPR